ncbi:helix-turn-helix domain-containing protein [Luteimicrobium sp. NPDC057192]|uniref:helix-turn-helix domain-containing protein n=1 Tax=Luteimicrobium sp. NPDC057192 TaxID=3346042 RepID=UPI00363AA325
MGELAQLLGVSTTWVGQRAHDGELPAYKVGKNWRFDAEQVGNWLSLKGNRATYSAPPRFTLPDSRTASGPAPQYPVRLDDALSADEAAERLKVPVDAIKRWARMGMLPGVKTGPSWRIDRHAFERWLEILAEHPLDHLEPGRLRTSATIERIEAFLLVTGHGHMTPSPGSWKRHGGKIPTWAEVVAPLPANAAHQTSPAARSLPGATRRERSRSARRPR